MKPEAAIEWAGSQAELARRCEVTRAAVAQWVTEGRVPLTRAYQIQVISKGAVVVDPALYHKPTEAA